MLVKAKFSQRAPHTLSFSHSLSPYLSLSFCLPTTLVSHKCGHFSKAARVDSPVNWSLMPISLYSEHCTHTYTHTTQVVDTYVCLSVCLSVCLYTQQCVFIKKLRLTTYLQLATSAARWLVVVVVFVAVTFVLVSVTIIAIVNVTLRKYCQVSLNDLQNTKDKRYFLLAHKCTSKTKIETQRKILWNFKTQRKLTDGNYS